MNNSEYLDELIKSVITEFNKVCNKSDEIKIEIKDNGDVIVYENGYHVDTIFNELYDNEFDFIIEFIYTLQFSLRNFYFKTYKCGSSGKCPCDYKYFGNDQNVFKENINKIIENI